jgi:hypothetical protein
MAQELSCKNCKFWDHGICRRNPPQCAGIVPQRHQITGETYPAIMAGWPNTDGDAWCGEYIAGGKIIL